MAQLHIEHLRKRYRLPADALDERSRLDRLLQQAIDGDLLDSALDRAGIPSSDEICIRRVDSFVRLDRTCADSRLAAEWSAALAAAIARRLDAGGPDVVRYRDRYVALVDMVCAVTRGDLDRVWAWRSLGLWRAGDAIDVPTARFEAVEALARDARLAPAVLCAVARRGLLSLLVSRVPSQRWVALARTSLLEWTSSELAICDLLLDGGQDIHDTIDESEANAIAAEVARVGRASIVLRNVTGAAVAASGTRARIALAVLAMLECEPNVAVSPHAPAIVKELVLKLGTRASASLPRPTPVSKEERAASRPLPPALDQVAATQPEHESSDTTGPSPSDDRIRGSTAFGGLLFLLHLVRILDLPTSLLRDPTLSMRPLRWTLHRLALLLASVDDSDAAALAFAGLAPGSRAPSKDHPPMSADEDSALRATGDKIIASLRLHVDAEVDESDASLLRRITSRRAEVFAEPTWIELRFNANDASTDVRRAGLDLDLGWLPWLGAVVTFAYV